MIITSSNPHQSICYPCEGKTLAIISNQNGIVTKNVTKLEVQRKVDSVLASVGIPMDFICATEDDGFKKPRTGTFLVLTLPNTRNIEVLNVFFE